MVRQSIIILCLSQMLAAETLFTEDFNRGTINRESWNVHVGPEGEIHLVDLGNRDFALAITDKLTWETSIMSHDVFPRGGNLHVRFKVWGDTGKKGGSQTYPGVSTLTGPWHSHLFDSGCYFTLEAGLNRWYDSFTFDENRSYQQRPLPDNEAFCRAWAKATSKKNALAIRVFLGDKTGAAFEWNDGSGWRTSIDTRGQVLDVHSTAQKGAKSDIGNTRALGNVIGSAAYAKLGFVPVDSWVFIDDIVVENDLQKTDNPKPTQQTVAPTGRPWTHLDYYNDPQNFQFAIVSDLTGGERQGVFQDAVKKLNLLRPEFVITVGDLVEGYVENEILIDNLFNEFDLKVSPLQMPFFYVPGNHDVSNGVMLKKWQQRYGKDYYHFIYKDVLFLCMNSNDNAHYTIGKKQIEYAAQALKDNQDVRWTLVFMHDPMWLYDWQTGWSQVESMLQDRAHTVFVGHIHLYAKTKRNNQNYYILATTGGSSTLGGADVDGHFDHIMWVTMTDEGPIIANLELTGIYDDAVRTEDMPEVRDQLERKRKFMEEAAKRMGTWSK